MDAAVFPVVRFDGNVDGFIDCARKNKPQIVVGMFADQVDAARRSKQGGSFAVKFFKLFLNFSFHSCNEVIIVCFAR